MAAMFAFNRFISVSALIACLVSVYLAIEIKSGGIDIRNLMREAWPLPRTVVLHDVGVFGPNSEMYKYYTGKDDIASFSDHLFTDSTLDATAWNSFELMKYASGCYQDTAYVVWQNTFPLLQKYDASTSYNTKTGLPARSVCKCIENIKKVVNSNLTLTSIKSNFNDWLDAFGHADNNYIVMQASDALTEATSAAYVDLQTQARLFYQLKNDDKKTFIANAAERCFLSSQPEYVLKYAGEVGTKILIFNGIMLLVFAVLGSVFKFPSEQPSAGKKEYIMLWAVSLCYYVYFVLVLIWTFNEPLRDHVFGSKFRSFDDATQLTNNKTSFIQPVNILQILYDTILLLVLGLMSFLFAAQQIETTLPSDSSTNFVKYFRKVGGSVSLYLPNSDNLIWKCVQNDLPYIIGYASVGLGLLLANGMTAVNSAIFAFILLIGIGFIQHVSNVNKIVYDALCQNTASGDMQKLSTPSESKEDDVVPMRTNLMFFGWTRVLWFLVIFALTFAVMSFTRASTDNNQFSGFLNSHIFWFVIALFWANVGYDILRELLPFQFETTPPNQHKVIITSSYLVFLCWSLSSLMYQVAHNKNTHHLYAH